VSGNGFHCLYLDVGSYADVFLIVLMRNLKYLLLIVVLFLPDFAFAHGEQILGTIFLQFLMFVILVVGMFIVPLNERGKYFLAGIYGLATLIVWKAVDKLPYSKYEGVINLLVVGLPLTVGMLGYILLKGKFGKVE
jgi:hypothetical protein